MFGQGSLRQNRRHRFISNKGLDSRERIHDGSYHPIRPRQQESAPERDIENRLRDKCHPPGCLVINACNQDLARRELQQFSPRAVPKRRDQALRNEHDAFTCPKYSMRDRIVVAERTLPGVADVDAIEDITTQRHRSSPCEVPAVVTQCCDDRRIPGRSQQRRKTSTLGGIPAVAAGRPCILLLERSNQPLNPLL